MSTWRTTLDQDTERPSSIILSPMGWPLEGGSLCPWLLRVPALEGNRTCPGVKGGGEAAVWCTRPGAVLQTLLVSFEFQGGRIDAVPQARGLRAVVENVAQVSVAPAAHQLGPLHEEAVVGAGPDVLPGDRLGEARPSGPRLELILRKE